MITTPKVVRVNKLGDSGIDIKIMGDTKPSRHWDVMGNCGYELKILLMLRVSKYLGDTRRDISVITRLILVKTNIP